MKKRVAALIVALFADPAVGSVADGSQLASVVQVQKALENLLTGTEDAGRSFDQLYKQRRRWCDAASHSFIAHSKADRTDIEHLSTDLKEQQAALEEAEGNVNEHRTQIELLRHTINVTDGAVQKLNVTNMNGSQKLSDLAETRQQSLMVIQGELNAMLQTQSDLQARVAETKRRAEDRSASVAQTGGFAKAVADRCAHSLQRGDKQSAGMVAEVSFIEKALTSLQQVGPPPSGANNQPRAIRVAAEDKRLANELAEVSLMQMGSGITTDDALTSLFGVEAVVAADSSDADEGDKKAVEHPVAKHDDGASGEVQQLLSQLQSEGGTDSARHVWCAKERAHNAALLDLAHTSASQSAAAADAHRAAEQQLVSVVGKLRSDRARLEATAKEVADGAARELALMRTAGRVRALTTKILAQAVKVLGNLGSAAGGEDDALQQKAASALDDLAQVKDALQQQAQAAASAREEAEASGKAAAAMAIELAHTLGREREHLEVTLDSHAAQRLRHAQEQLAHKAEASEAEEYAQALEKECQPQASAQEERQRRAELRLLEDAQKVLQGKPVVHERALRGDAAKKVDMRKLTPLERAAHLMGVSE